MLTPRELLVCRDFVRLVRLHVRAELVQASLFGSRARGTAREDSDIDILLVFRRLPADREPQASHAERIAARVADAAGLPLTAWAVSMRDLWRGNRTPMLVDALEDSIPLWCAGGPLRKISFTPDDARSCVSALLDRIGEGAYVLAYHLARADDSRAARRVRDDLVRACTAVLLAAGITRPRRGEAVAAYLAITRSRLSGAEREVLAWARDSFGPDGRDGDAPVARPPSGIRVAARVVAGVAREAWMGRRALGTGR